MKERHYIPSGKFGSMALVILAVLTLLIFPILGYAYAYLGNLISMIYVKFFLTLGYAFVAGLILSFWVTRGKIRNGTLYLVGAILALLVGYYVHWAAFFGVQLSDSMEGGSFVGFISDPSMLNSMISLYNMIGIETTSKGSTSSYTGTTLYIFWAIEMAIMVLGPLFLSYSEYKMPFSELNDTWFNANKLNGMMTIYQSENDMKAALKNGDYSCLENAIPATTDNNDFYRLTLFDSVGDEDFLTLRKVAVSYDKGKRNENETVVINHLRVPNDTTQLLLAKWA